MKKWELKVWKSVNVKVWMSESVFGYLYDLSCQHIFHPEIYLDFFWQRTFQPLFCHIGNLWNSDKKWRNNLEEDRVKQERKLCFQKSYMSNFNKKKIWKQFKWDLLSLKLWNSKHCVSHKKKGLAIWQWMPADIECPLFGEWHSIHISW